MKPARIYPLEHQEQSRLMTWAAIKCREMPELALLFAVPNGGLRNLRVAAKMKAEGLKAGVPDLVLPVARGGYHALFIEMKTVNNRPKNGGKGGVTQIQEWWHEKLIEQKNKVAVCYGSDEAIATIEQYLKN